MKPCWVWERRSRPVSGVKGWLTFGAWRRPSVARVSINFQYVSLGHGNVRRRECRVVGVDMLPIGTDEGDRRKRGFTPVSPLGNRFPRAAQVD